MNRKGRKKHLVKRGKGVAAVKMFGKQLPWDTDVDIAESKLDWDRWVNATFELDKYGIWVRRMVVPNAYQPRKYKHVQVGELNIGGIRGDDYPFKEKITYSKVTFLYRECNENENTKGSGPARSLEVTNVSQSASLISATLQPII